MSEFINVAALDKITAVAIFALVAILVITDKLVWHTRLREERERTKKVESERDRWMQVALEALTVGAQAGVHAAEVTMGVVSALPDPEKEA